MTRDEAYELITEWLDNKNLVKHCLAVEYAMAAYALYFEKEDEVETWRIAGLLHDADWEKHPDQHPQKIVTYLQEHNASTDLINAIASHGFEFDEEPRTLMAYTLRAVDELTGLIVATALVRESKKLADVTVESVQKKWNTSGFARGVNREDIEQGANDINVPLEEHIRIVLTAMQAHSDELGL